MFWSVSGVTCGTWVDGHHLDVDCVLVKIVDIGPAVALLLDIAHRRPDALLVWLLEEVGERDDEADVEGVSGVILRSCRGASGPENYNKFCEFSIQMCSMKCKFPMCPECDSDGRGTTCAPYNVKVNYLEMMRTAGDCHKQCESQQEYAKVKFKRFKEDFRCCKN